MAVTCSETLTPPSPPGWSPIALVVENVGPDSAERIRSKASQEETVMPSWELPDDQVGEVDYRLVTNSWVTKFWNTNLLAETIQWLRDHRYDVVTVDAAKWRSTPDMLDSLAAALDFPTYFGCNFPALNDCMSDVAEVAYGAAADAAGLVLLFRNFDDYVEVEPSDTHALLNIVARQARTAALIGRRLMCLLHTNDPRLEFEPVGAQPVLWNEAEFLNSSRGIGPKR
jgi:hypothetical protein